jgi:hypothetical protein
MSGLKATATTVSGSGTTTVYGLSSELSLVGSSTTGYGVRISSSGAGAITTYYGLYVESSLSTVTNHYGIYQAGAGAINSFAGLVLTAATTATNAGLRLPHGAEPTAPVDGDLWSTTSGFYGRVNGATVGPFGVSGGGTPGGVDGNVQLNDGLGGFAGSDSLRWSGGLLTTSGASGSLRIQHDTDEGRVDFGNVNVTRWSIGSATATTDFTFVLYDAFGNYADMPISIIGTAGGTVSVNRPLSVSGTVQAVFFSTTPQDVSASATINSGRVRFTGSTVAQTLTLPVVMDGLDVFIRNSASVSVTVEAGTGSTIEGLPTFTLLPGEAISLTLVSSDWTIF